MQAERRQASSGVPGLDSHPARCTLPNTPKTAAHDMLQCDIRGARDSLPATKANLAGKPLALKGHVGAPLGPSGQRVADALPARRQGGTTAVCTSGLKGRERGQSGQLRSQEQCAGRFQNRLPGDWPLAVNSGGSESGGEGP